MHLKIERRISTRQTFLTREKIFGEHLINDFHHIFILENFEIAGKRREIQPRANLYFKHRLIRVSPDITRALHQARYFAPPAPETCRFIKPVTVDFHRDRHFFTHEGFEIDIRRRLPGNSSIRGRFRGKGVGI